MAKLIRNNCEIVNNQINITTHQFAVPPGFVYTQYPLQLAPWELFGDDISWWEDISYMYAGLFTRIEGQNTETFEKVLPCTTNDTILTFETTEHGITTFSILIDITTWEQRQVTNVDGANVTLLEAFSNISNERKVLIIEREQLPNVTGEAGDLMYDNAVAIISKGALYFTGPQRSRDWKGDTGTGSRRLKFNLKRGNNIYEDNGQTRPTNIIVKVWKKLAEPRITDPLIIDINFEEDGEEESTENMEPPIEEQNPPNTSGEPYIVRDIPPIDYLIVDGEQYSGNAYIPSVPIRDFYID